MTLRPRHYARVLIEGEAAETIARRIETLSALADVRRQLAELLTIPTARPAVERTLAELHVDELTQSIVRELSLTGHLDWLPAIRRGAEQLIAATGHSAIAHVRLAHPDLVTDGELSRSLESALGSIGTVRTTIDPNQLGGIIIQVADQRFDAGLARRLSAVRRALRSVSSKVERKE